MTFQQWLESQGCTVEVTQDDDGSGYVVLDVITPDGNHHDVTVNS
jgi:hypothetical protein